MTVDITLHLLNQRTDNLYGEMMDRRTGGNYRCQETKLKQHTK